MADKLAAIRPSEDSAKGDEEEDVVDLEEMIGFLEAVNEPLESDALDSAIEDLKLVHQTVNELEEIVGEVTETVDDLIDSLDEEDAPEAEES